MFSLTNPQKRQLKALAHPRKPVVIIGDNGLTDAVMQEIEIALDHHELIKIRVNAEDRAAVFFGKLNERFERTPNIRIFV